MPLSRAFWSSTRSMWMARWAAHQTVHHRAWVVWGGVLFYPFFPQRQTFLNSNLICFLFLDHPQQNLPNGPDSMKLYFSIFAIVFKFRGEKEKNKYRKGAEVSQPIPSSSWSPQAPMRLNHRVNTNLLCQLQQIGTASRIKNSTVRIQPTDLRFKVLLNVKGQEDHYRWC